MLIKYIRDKKYQLAMVQLLEESGYIAFLYQTYKVNNVDVILQGLRFLMFYLKACRNTHGYHPFELSRLAVSQISRYIIDNNKKITQEMFDIIWEISYDDDSFRDCQYTLFVLKFLGHIPKPNPFLFEIYKIITNPATGEKNCKYIINNNKWWYYFIPIFQTQSKFDECSQNLLSLFHILFLYELKHKQDSSLLEFQFNMFTASKIETKIFKEIGSGFKRMLPGFMSSKGSNPLAKSLSDIELRYIL